LLTTKRKSKKLKPNGNKLQLIFAAIDLSEKIIEGLIKQAYIPRGLKPRGLDDRRVRKFEQGEKISHEQTTRMLEMALPHHFLVPTE
jgi:hypothetical protein